MTGQSGASVYFRHVIPIYARKWHSLGLDASSQIIGERQLPPVIFYRQLALSLNKAHQATAQTVYASHLNLFAVLQTVYRYMIDILAEDAAIGVLEQAVRRSGYDPAGGEAGRSVELFVEMFPPAEVLSGEVPAASWLKRAENQRRMVLREMLLLNIAAENQAVRSFRDIFDDQELAQSSSYKAIAVKTHAALEESPFVTVLGRSLGEALLAPVKAAPYSIADQVRFVRDTWSAVLPPAILAEIATALDILLEEERERGWGGEPGPPPVLEFKRGRPGGGGRGDSIFGGFDYPEYERFSQDADWMSNVVMMAKMVYIWLDQMSRSHGFQITRLDQVPDSELDRLAARGFTGLWLIGLWERSPASQRIKQICGNQDAIASAYSLYDYEVAADLGGWEALGNLRERAAKRGIRLASDMVPNHTGIYSRWVIQHPDWFVQTDYPPFPTYQFNGEDLSHDGNVCIQVEDGYWSKHDAAVVFKHYDRRDGRTRYIYHGNDGTSIPWNDTAQLNYLIPEVREAVIQTILHVARNFQIIRFDAAMTLAKKHYQRLWFPLRGLGGGIPSRAEHGMSKEEFDAVFPVEFWREVVDRVAVEAPGTLLLAEAFWMMEGYFVRTLGMHRVYNSAFMNMLKTEENAKYRTTIKNVLAFNHEILKRFVNFMNNPDEKTAVAQFGSQGKYFGACVLLATMPGLPMFGHGQIEGFHEKYGMEYKRAYWDEQVDEGLVRGHEMWIFPLLRRRWLFSGSENFVMYDFHVGDHVDENVFAYSNRVGEHRALVLYHNSHTTTSGWIKESVFFAITGEGEQPELDRTSLADAVGATDEDNCFLAFRDQTEGLEYLRSTRELRQHGLYVELNEYQFHVFMDFREVRDDLDGSWLRLYRQLNGSGVISLEEQRKQMMYAGLNAAFRTVFELLQDTGGEGKTTATGTELQQTIDLFLKSDAEGELTALPVDKPRAVIGKGKRKVFRKKSAVIEQYTRFAELKGHKATAGHARSFLLRLTAGFSDPAAESLMLAWLVLRETTLDPVSRGLDYTLRKFLQRDGDSGFGSRGIGLLVALLEWWRSLERDSTATALKTMQSLFELEACRKFLLNHESDGIEWFNKERFEELCEWITVILLLEGCNTPLSARVVSMRMGEAERALRLGTKLAQDVGFRSRLFAELPEKSISLRPPRPKKS